MSPYLLQQVFFVGRIMTECRVCAPVPAAVHGEPFRDSKNKPLPEAGQAFAFGKTDACFGRDVLLSSPERNETSPGVRRQAFSSISRMNL